MPVTSPSAASDLPGPASAALGRRNGDGRAPGVIGAAIDPAFRLIAVTPAYADTFAGVFGAVPRVGDDLRDLMAFRPDRGAWQRRLWERALAGEEVSALLVAEPPGCRRRFFKCLFRPLRDGQGDVAAAVQVVRDVTEELFERARLVERGLRPQDRQPEPQQEIRAAAAAGFRPQAGRGPRSRRADEVPF